MPRITLNSAVFHGFSFTTGPKRGKGGALVIADFSAPWTETNRKAGNWKELPDSVSGTVHLVPGQLSATTVTFKPNKGFESHEFSLDVTGATGFECFVPVKEDQDRELRFKIETPSEKAGKKLDTFGRTVGGAPGRLTISYDEPEQTKLISEQQALDTASDE
jgi:hypothetical protein